MGVGVTIKGILFDLDGVLYVGNTPIEGAIEAVKKLRDDGLICRFATNTSTLSLDSLQKKMNAMGFDVAKKEIFSAPQAVMQYLRAQKNPVCRLLLADDVKQDFAEFTQSDLDPEFIVVGDIGDAWTYPLLNDVFNALMRGAKLIAIHKNRFWQTKQGLQMDIGAFIDGLEYASAKQAMVIGKPAKDFFHIAIDDMKLNPENVLMVGDDVDVDIGGAQHAGLKAVLVRTGKFRQNYVEASPIVPDAIIDSIADLPKLLDKRCL
jgi:HAD superfamily hydrolase (TIGR01458 family)